MVKPQLKSSNAVRHLLGVRDLSIPQIHQIFKTANHFADGGKSSFDYADQMLINLFFEPSTRTQLSFELAAKRLGLSVANFILGNSSMSSKGESVMDTIKTIEAMHPTILVIRHAESGAPQILSRYVDCPVVNAGDGSHEHPSQALLDALTIHRNKGEIAGLKIVICGDILHSRVALSNIYLLSKLGANLHLVAPPTLLPSAIDAFDIPYGHDFDKAIVDADVIMMLRIQKERMNKHFIPSLKEYSQFYGLNTERLNKAHPNALVMHPGPVNRDVEIEGALVESCLNSVIDQQVQMGVFIRMAILEELLHGEEIK